MVTKMAEREQINNSIVMIIRILRNFIYFLRLTVGFVAQKFLASGHDTTYPLTNKVTYPF